MTKDKRVLAAPHSVDDSSTMIAEMFTELGDLRFISSNDLNRSNILPGSTWGGACSFSGFHLRPEFGHRTNWIYGTTTSHNLGDSYFA